MENILKVRYLLDIEKEQVAYSPLIIMVTSNTKKEHYNLRLRQFPVILRLQ